MVKHCCLGEPLKSSFILCSRTHITAPIAKKHTAMTPHMPGVNGRRKAQGPEFNFFNGATTTRPDEAYGCVKSTILVLLVTIAISPTAASNLPAVIIFTRSV
uniref:Uncharacterized protein n=1 Tax=Opuntia streptacantha TaxID=393608 RepID=A0A7C9ACR3_OPUST